MSFYDDASLVFLPSGGAGKDGKAYSMKPTDGNGDFTFSRGSNLTATRVDSNGLIEKGRENLLLQSNQFDTTWVTSNTSVTSGQSGYDGSSDAWLLNSTTTGSPRIQQIVSSSGVSTYSVYAKAATDDFVQLRAFMSPSGDASIWIDLSNGVIVNSSGAAKVTSNIESIGSGWYRCSLTFNGTLSHLRIYPASAFGTYSTSGNGVYIQDAQLEQGLVATEPIESGATTGLAGILEDSPRFDYSGGASCPSLLLEPQRTNLVGYSEYYNDWDKNSGTTLTANNAISPDGNQNATLVECPLTGGRVGYDVALTSGTTYTFSIYLKNNGGDTSISIGSHGTAQLETITINNDWNRYSTTFTATSTITSNIRFVSSGSNINMYAFGAQLEEGSYPTSYIPNHSGGSVTRNGDVNTLLNQSGVIGQTEGTIYVNWIATEHSSNSQIFDIGNGNVDRITLIHNSNNSLRVLVRTNNTSIIDYTESSAIVGGNTYKAAFSYSDSSGYAFYLNGSKLTDGTDIVDFSTSVDDIYMNSTFTDSNKEKNNYKQFLLFDTRISDNNLATLTS